MVVSKSEIYEFLHHYGDFLFEEHIKDIESFLAMMILQEKYSKIFCLNGYHFQNCIWSDTSIMNSAVCCRCTHYQTKHGDITKLINKYKALIKRL